MNGMTSQEFFVRTWEMLLGRVRRAADTSVYRSTSRGGRFRNPCRAEGCPQGSTAIPLVCVHEFGRSGGSAPRGVEGHPYSIHHCSCSGCDLRSDRTSLGISGADTAGRGRFGHRAVPVNSGASHSHHTLVPACITESNDSIGSMPRHSGSPTSASFEIQVG